VQTTGQGMPDKTVLYCVAFDVAFGGKADMGLECAPRAGQVAVIGLTGCAGLSKDESHAQTTAFAQH